MSVVIYTSIYTTFASFQQTDQRNINNIRNNSSHKHTSQQELPLILRVLPVFPRMAMSGPGTKNYEWQVLLTQPKHVPSGPIRIQSIAEAHMECIESGGKGHWNHGPWLMCVFVKGVLWAFIPLADNQRGKIPENQGIIHTISTQIHMGTYM